MEPRGDQQTRARSQPEADPASLRPRDREELRLIDLLDSLYEGKEVFFRYVRTVGDIMTRDVETLTLDHKIADAIALFEKRGVRHVPIVEVESTDDPSPPRHILIGIVSQRDVAQALSHGIGTVVQSEGDDKALEQSLGTIITRKPHTIRADTPFFEAVQRVVDEKVDCLPVVTGELGQLEPIGILTTTDIIKCLVRMEVLRKAREVKPRSVRLIDFVRFEAASQPTELLLDALMGRVSDVMREEVTTVNVGDSLEEAMDRMQAHRIRHLPVVDGAGRLKGILSDRDILAQFPPKAQRRATKIGDPSGFRQALFHIDPDDEETTRALSAKVAVAMTGDPVTVEPTDSLLKVAEIFCERRFGSVPVASRDDATLKGIVTQTDLLGAFLAIGRLRGSMP